MIITAGLPATTTRVERHTAPEVNRAIRARTAERLGQYAREPATRPERRLRELDAEWDVERVLEANASTIALTGVVLGALVDRRFLALPAAVLGFLALHAVQGWCPPIPVIRRMGVRTAREIERERHALKALRGDYDGLPQPADGEEPAARVRAALAAVDR